MLMVCPQCKGSFDGVLQCPKCRVRLLLPGDKSVQAAEGPSQGKWHQTGPGRIIAGLVLGLGLSYGLLLLASVAMRASKMDLSAQASAVVFVGIQAVALLAGGMLAGAGQSKGIACGAGVGLVSGGLVLGLTISGMMASIVAPFTKDHPIQGLPPIPPLTPEAILVYGPFIGNILFGALGGLLGVMLWKPLPKLDLPTSVPTEQKPILGTKLALPPQGDKKALFPWAGPIAWIRVLIGMGVAAVGGAIGTKPVMNFLIEFSGLEDIVKVQQDVVNAELLALSVLFGGCVAGATTSNGLKQGVLVGIGAGIAMVGYFVSQGGAGPEKLLGPLLVCVFLGPLGGWFGSELMPPAARGFRRRKKSGWL